MMPLLLVLLCERETRDSTDEFKRFCNVDEVDGLCLVGFARTSTLLRFMMVVFGDALPLFESAELLVGEALPPFFFVLALGEKILGKL